LIDLQKEKTWRRAAARGGGGEIRE